MNVAETIRIETSAGFSSRLRDILKDKSILSFAKKCGLSDGLIRKYLAGSLPGVDKLIILAKAADVEIKWLATGEGPMKPGDAQAAPVAIDVELMGQIMAIFMQAAHDNETSLPAKDIGEMAASAYQDILTDFPDPESRQKALAHLTAIAANIARLYV